MDETQKKTTKNFGIFAAQIHVGLFLMMGRGEVYFLKVLFNVIAELYERDPKSTYISTILNPDIRKFGKFMIIFLSNSVWWGSNKAEKRLSRRDSRLAVLWTGESF